MGTEKKGLDIQRIMLYSVAQEETEKMASPTIQARLPQADHAKVIQAAMASKTTVSEWVRQAVYRALGE